MKFTDYKNFVAYLSIGKKLPDSIYLHKSYTADLPSELASFLAETEAEMAVDHEWNVVKFYRRDHKVTFLHYPTFDTDSYPTLSASLTVDFVRRRARKTNYAKSDNPPILHRKETLVAPDYPHYELFVEITEEGENIGLYERTTRIGFRKPWEKLIKSKGFTLVGGRLKPINESLSNSVETNEDIEVQRHLTAIERDKLSAPMQHLARHGFLDGDFTILDYGCGKGHDVLELETHGIDIAAWDPAHRPEGQIRPSDVVNLGYVINVIDDLEERRATMQRAFSLAHKLMAVSVMIGGEATVAKFQPYKDGVLTTRDTFQKYFTQNELREFIAEALGKQGIAISPGIFFVFRDGLEEQAFLANRQRVKREWRHIYERPRTSPQKDYEKLLDDNNGLVEEFWSATLDFGRIIANDEFERSEEVRRFFGSHKRLFDLAKERYGDEELSMARIGRIEDLLVYFALSFFDQDRAYARMPRSLQRDVKAFFGKPSDAYQHARASLFSVADTNKIAAACELALAETGCGRIFPGESYLLPVRLLDSLPAILRIYVGCATALYGELEYVDLIKIHFHSGKLSLLSYDDFNKRLPILKKRVKILLREQDYHEFFYRDENKKQPIYFRSLYLDQSHPDHGPQLEFDQLMAQVPGIKRGELGPNVDELADLLANNRVENSSLILDAIGD